MDISDTLAPKSDQLDAVDLLGGPQIFTVTDVSRGNAEQPVNVHLAEFPRVWRPSKGMRRVLAHCWGKDAKGWIGHRVELFCDPDVMFGPERVGGTRISRLSHIDAPKSVPSIVKRGKSATYRVDPLPDAPTPPSESAIACATDKDQLREWHRQFPALRDAILARVAEIDSQPVAEGEIVEGDQ